MKIRFKKLRIKDLFLFGLNYIILYYFIFVQLKEIKLLYFNTL